MTTVTEPSLKELKQICKDLYTQESTEDNLKKIRAIEAQIARHEAPSEDGSPDGES